MLRRFFRTVYELYDGYVNFGKAELEQLKKLQEKQKQELELAKRLHDGFDAKSEDVKMEALRQGMKTLQHAETTFSAAEREAAIKLKEMLDKAVPDPPTVPAAPDLAEMKKRLASEKTIGDLVKDAQERLKEENKPNK